jgi:hypothetical protein
LAWSWNTWWFWTRTVKLISDSQNQLCIRSLPQVLLPNTLSSHSWIPLANCKRKRVVSALVVRQTPDCHSIDNLLKHVKQTPE